MEDQDQYQKDLIRLRQRLLDLQGTQRLSTEAYGLYQQTILQIHQEAERRKQTCFQQAATLRAQASAAESQGHAFSSIASIIYAVVNGYIEVEEKRLREDQERRERLAEETAPDSPPTALAPESRKKRKGNAGEASSD